MTAFVEPFIVRADDKPTIGTIAQYSGNARAGELVVDPTVTPPVLYVADITGNLRSDWTGGAGGGGGGGGTGTVTSVSVATTNGLAGTVATATSTPTITLSTTVTGVVKGNGTSFSAATAGTDYVVPSGSVATVTTAAQPNITSVGTLTGLTVNGPTNLGSNTNLTLTGGSSGQVLSTDGAGALSWASVATDTGWSSAPIFINATNGSPVKGTTVHDVVRWRKVGNKIYQVKYLYYQSTAGTNPGVGVYIYSLPGGLQFDPTVQPMDNNVLAGSVTTLGQWSNKIVGSIGSLIINGSPSTQVAYAFDGNRFCMLTIGGAGGASFGGFQNAGYYQLTAAGLFMEMEFTFTATT